MEIPRSYADKRAEERVSLVKTRDSRFNSDVDGLKDLERTGTGLKKKDKKDKLYLKDTCFQNADNLLWAFWVAGINVRTRFEGSYKGWGIDLYVVRLAEWINQGHSWQYAVRARIAEMRCEEISEDEEIDERKLRQLLYVVPPELDAFRRYMQATGVIKAITEDQLEKLMAEPTAATDQPQPKTEIEMTPMPAPVVPGKPSRSKRLTGFLVAAVLVVAAISIGVIQEIGQTRRNTTPDNSVSSNISAELKNVQTERDEARRELGSARANLATATALLESTKTERDQARADHLTATAKITSVSVERDELLAKLITTTALLATATADLMSAQGERDEAKASNEKLALEKGQLASDHAQCATRTSELENRIKELENRIAELNRELATTQTANSDLLTQNAVLLRQLTSLEADRKNRQLAIGSPDPSGELLNLELAKELKDWDKLVEKFFKELEKTRKKAGQK